MLVVRGVAVGGLGLDREAVGDISAAVEHFQQIVADQAAIFTRAALSGIELDPSIAGETAWASDVGLHHADAPPRCLLRYVERAGSRLSALCLFLIARKRL